jgi:hypothetical protein
MMNHVFNRYRTVKAMFDKQQIRYECFADPKALHDINVQFQTIIQNSRRPHENSLLTVLKQNAILNFLKYYKN